MDSAISFVVDPSNDPVVQDLRRFYSGDYMDYLHRQTAGVLRNHISFVGHVQRTGVPAHLADADVLVEPSVWDEPFGIPVVEAMASSLPVVATTVGGIPEFVKHQWHGDFSRSKRSDCAGRWYSSDLPKCPDRKNGQGWSGAGVCAVFMGKRHRKAHNRVRGAGLSGSSIAS